MALLSVSVGTTVQQSVQAQTQDPADTLERSQACDRAMKEDGEEMEGGYFFDDFKGLNLTDKQKKAYEALDAQAEAKRAKVYKESISVADPAAILSFSSSPGVSIPPDVQAAIQEALNSNPKMDKEAALNQKFGKYGIFIGSYITYLTSEQQAQIDQATKDFYAQVQDLMTPEQQPQYSKNLAARLRINAACDVKGPISSYPALGQISDKIPTTK
jgi:Spy/CpxP family protein refolding chaperone